MNVHTTCCRLSVFYRQMFFASLSLCANCMTATNKPLCAVRRCSYLLLCFYWAIHRVLGQYNAAAILSVRRSICPSVRLPVCHTCKLRQNSWTEELVLVECLPLEVIHCIIPGFKVLGAHKNVTKIKILNLQYCHNCVMYLLQTHQY